jgi:ATP-dependent DNA helicase RecQ
LLARELGLPYVESFAVRAGEPQSAMLNSVQQLANAHRRIGRGPAADIPTGPVLLVDDLVDSKWTMTVAGSLLREWGSGPVHPFALAVASARES